MNAINQYGAIISDCIFLGVAIMLCSPGCTGDTKNTSSGSSSDEITADGRQAPVWNKKDANGTGTTPIAAITFWSHGIRPPTSEGKKSLQLGLLIVVCRDGTVIWWDKNHTPRRYLRAVIEERKVKDLLKDLEALATAGRALKQCAATAPDCAVTEICLWLDSGRFEMASLHEWYERFPQFAVDDSGFHLLEHGELRESFNATWSSDYREFRHVWSNIRETVDRVIPEEGTPISELPLDVQAALQARRIKGG